MITVVLSAGIIIENLVSERGEKGMISESWISLASRPSPKQQLQGAGIIDFEGINSQLQVVPFQGIICKPSCSHTPAGTGGLVQNPLKQFGQQFQDYLWVNKSPSWEEPQSIWHQGEAHLQTISSKMEEKWFLKWGTGSFHGRELWGLQLAHIDCPGAPEPAQKVQTGKQRLQTPDSPS